MSIGREKSRDAAKKLLDDYLKILLQEFPSDPKELEINNLIKKSQNLKSKLESNYFDYEPLILPK